MAMFTWRRVSLGLAIVSFLATGCGSAVSTGGAPLGEDGSCEGKGDCLGAEEEEEHEEASVCGDGLVSRGEQCDDGGVSGADGCSSNCAWTIQSIAAGSMYTCAILHGGDLKCWGRNGVGQLGLGDLEIRGDAAGEMGSNLPAVDLGAGEAAVAVAAGFFHSCAVLQGGQVKCWGKNAFGALGLGDTVDRGGGLGEMGDDLPAVDLGEGARATSVVVGYHHTCALLDDGRVKCWGLNAYGQLGLGDDDPRGDGPNEMGDHLPVVDLGEGEVAAAIVGADMNTCALLQSGGIKCWGFSIYGQLGLGDTESRGDDPDEMGDNLPAIDLGAGRTATAVATRRYSTCAILDNGGVKCWGLNDRGELGLGDTARRGDDPNEMGDNLPMVDLGAGATAAAIDVGEASACALLHDGRVKCWGYNYEGDLGLGDVAPRGDDPNEMGDDLPAVDLGAGRTATAIAKGWWHTCARLDDGSLKCWGLNAEGELGQGDTVSRGDEPGEMGDALPPVELF
jgi:cysteine-rich repeat protein